MQQIYNKIPLLILTVFMAGACLAGCKKKDMSLKLNEPRNIKGVISYKRSFGDLNEKHLNIAQTIGIPPIASRTEAEGMKKKLQHIETNDLYKVDSLTHSIPYLIPGAARLLDSIGSHFLDSLASKGLNPNKVIVTSVLRTKDDVKRLRRRNRNAVDTSAHLYGTTFDISYLKFICDSTQIPRTQEDMKNLLGEVVQDFRLKGRCYVKYERKQSCYHITVR